MNGDNCDLFDVLSYLAYNTPLITRQQRVDNNKENILRGLNQNKEFLDFVLSKYEEKGVEELDEEKLPILLNMKYHAIANAEQSLGSVENIRSIFLTFRKIYTQSFQKSEFDIPLPFCQ